MSNMPDGHGVPEAVAPETAEAAEAPGAAPLSVPPDPRPGPAPGPAANSGSGGSDAAPQSQPSPKSPSWAGFLEHYDALCKKNQACLPGLRQVNAKLQDDELTLRCPTRFQYEGLQAPQKYRSLEQLLREYFGPALRIKLLPPRESDGKTQGRPNNDPRLDHPLVREFAERFQAKVVSLEPYGNDSGS